MKTLCPTFYALGDKLWYGVCTVFDYLLFGGSVLLRYRTPEYLVVERNAAPADAMVSPNRSCDSSIICSAADAHDTHSDPLVGLCVPFDEYGLSSKVLNGLNSRFGLLYMDCDSD